MSERPRNGLARLRLKLVLLFRKGQVYRYLEFGCVLLLAATLALTYWIVSERHGHQALLPAPLTAALLVTNLVPALVLMSLIGRRIAMRRSAGTMGQVQGRGRLHVRFVALFSLISSIPMILVVIFASLLFQNGVEFWFSERARNMLENANDLARGYYEESRRDVSAETIAMASDLREYLAQTSIDSPEFAEAYVFQVLSRKLNESAIVEMGKDGVIRTAAIIDPDNRASADRVTPEMVKELDNGKNVVVSAGPDRIEVVTTLDRQGKIYLYSARASNQLALSQWERAQNVLSDYDALFARSQTLQIRFNIALFMVSLLLVAIALWVALRFADRMVSPLTDLVAAARDISAGNFSTRVGATHRTDEVGMLGRAFNRMTQRLSEQTSALIRANNQLDDRRAFIEAVLESVTAGVISVDPQGMVRLINSTAQLLLQRDLNQILGQPIRDVAPQLAQLLDEDVETSVIQYSRGTELLTFAVKTVREPYGQVVTFEDITQQMLDQRQAAWSDVARRIAHEIKNPLTPIQLAAERLKRRYARQLEDDQDIFVQLTDTIVRQVGDLRNMVDEFSSFARLPKPVFREENFVDLVRQAIFLQEMAHPEIAFATTNDSDNIPLFCDRRQIGQSITNIVKNSIEAIEAALNIEKIEKGRLESNIAVNGNIVTLTIDDNGIGLPADRERIFEPYVTTREKGTGLGLAIVKKIVEEHFGDIGFESGRTDGTRVTISFDIAALRRFALSETRATQPLPPSDRDAVANETEPMMADQQRKQ